MCTELITDYKTCKLTDIMFKHSLLHFVGGIALGTIAYCALTALGISSVTAGVVAAIPISLGVLAGCAGLYMGCVTHFINIILNIIFKGITRSSSS